MRQGGAGNLSATMVTERRNIGNLVAREARSANDLTGFGPYVYGGWAVTQVPVRTDTADILSPAPVPIGGSYPSAERTLMPLDGSSYRLVLYMGPALPPVTNHIPPVEVETDEQQTSWECDERDGHNEDPADGREVVQDG